MKKITITPAHLKKDDKEAKQMITSAKKIVKIGKDIIKTDVKAKRNAK